MTSTNQQRIERCDQALAAYNDDLPNFTLIDFLTDAMHWCQATGFEFELKLETARTHFTPETAEADSNVCQCIPRKPIDVEAVLRRRRQVAVIWSIEDVQGERPDLSDDQAWQVLKRCRDIHDCAVGFHWDLIDCVADDLFPEPLETDK